MQTTYLGIATSVCLTLFWSLLVSIPVSLARDEQIIQQVSGQYHQHLEPFTVNDDWEFRWENKAEAGNNLFEIVLQSSATDAPVDLVTQKGSGQGAKHQKKVGPIT